MDSGQWGAVFNAAVSAQEAACPSALVSSTLWEEPPFFHGVAQFKCSLVAGGRQGTWFPYRISCARARCSVAGPLLYFPPDVRALSCLAAPPS